MCKRGRMGEGRQVGVELQRKTCVREVEWEREGR